MNAKLVRVYVGAVHSHRLLVEVLRWTLLRHTKRPLEVVSIGEVIGDRLALPQRPENRPATPFSFQRFAVPMLAGGQGRAIYVDSDQIVLGDIGELLDKPMFGTRLLRRVARGPEGRPGLRGSSVMLMHCERLQAWSTQRIADDLDAGRYSYRELMMLDPIDRKGWFSRHWNSYDHVEPGRTRLLHYTHRATQPWLCRDHAFGSLWFEALYSGLDAGEVSRDALAQAIERGYVRPSMAWQTERREVDATRVPADLHASDAAFMDFCRAQNFNNLEGDYRPDALPVAEPA